MRTANLVLRFALELSALAALAVWGASADGAIAWVLGAGAPLAAAVAWGAFVSPRAAIDAPRAVRWAVEAMVVAAASAALVATGRTILGLAFGGLALASGVIHHTGVGGTSPLEGAPMPRHGRARP